MASVDGRLRGWNAAAAAANKYKYNVHALRTRTKYLPCLEENLYIARTFERSLIEFNSQVQRKNARNPDSGSNK